MKTAIQVISWPNLGSPVRAMMKPVARYFRNKRQYQNLSDLPDHLLWDVGLTRADVDRAIRSNKWL